MKKIILIMSLLFSTVSADAISLQKGWNFIGFNKNIVIEDDVLLNSNKVQIVWTYSNNGESASWNAFSSDANTSTQISQAGYSTINNIFPYEGVWVYANEDFIYEQEISVPKFSLDQNIYNGWNLRSSIDGMALNTNNIHNASLIFVYRNEQWYAKGYGVLTNNFKELNSINENEAYWLFKTTQSEARRLTGSIKGSIPNPPSLPASTNDTDLTGYESFKNAQKIRAGLKFSADKVQNLRQEQIIKQEMMDKYKPKPITKPIDIPLEYLEDQQKFKEYNLTTVPTGTGYSLIYIDGFGKGIKVDEVHVLPESDENINLPPLKSTGNAVVSVSSLLTGSSIDNATIIVSEIGQSFTTNNDGIASIVNIPEGKYTLIIQKSGYAHKTVDIEIVSNEITNIPTVELNSRKGKISGNINIDINNKENILVYTKASDGSVFTALTNTSGNYFFNNIPVGDGYSIIAYTIGYDSRKISNIKVENGITTNVSEIRLNETKNYNGSIAGFARYQDVKNRFNHAGIIVSIEGTDFEAITARDGAFILNDIPVGSYVVNFTDSNHITKSRNIYVSDASSSKIDNLYLSPKTGNVSGKVVDEDSNIVENVFITINTPTATHTAITNSNGEFTINGVIAGEHEVLAAKGGYGAGSLYTAIIQNQTTDTTTTPIIVTRKLLTGQVEFNGAIDHSGAIVSLIDSGIPLGTTDSNGYFTLYGVGAGNYQLQVTKNGYETQIIPLAITSSNGYELNYKVEISLALGKIQGVVRLIGKESHSGVLVKSMDTNKTTLTDSNGFWELEIPIGNYNGIEFTKDNYKRILIDNTYTIVQNDSYQFDDVSLRQLELKIIKSYAEKNTHYYIKALSSENILIKKDIMNITPGISYYKVEENLSTTSINYNGAILFTNGYNFYDNKIITRSDEPNGFKIYNNKGLLLETITDKHIDIGSKQNSCYGSLVSLGSDSFTFKGINRGTCSAYSSYDIVNYWEATFDKSYNITDYKELSKDEYINTNNDIKFILNPGSYNINPTLNNISFSGEYAKNVNGVNFNDEWEYNFPESIIENTSIKFGSGGDGANKGLIAQYEDIIIFSRIYSFTDIATGQIVVNLYIAKLDIYGTLLFEKIIHDISRYQERKYFELKGVEYANGSLYFYGRKETSIDKNDIWIVKINETNGEFIYKTSFGTFDTEKNPLDDFVTTIKYIGNNKFIYTGTYNKYNPINISAILEE